MEIVSDDVAVGVTTNPDGTARDLLEIPVTAFCGWVKSDGETVLIYTDNWFMEWLEIPADKVVYQVKGADRQHDEFKSAVWVEADAEVTRYTDESMEAHQANEAFAAAGGPTTLASSRRRGQKGKAGYFGKRPDRTDADKPPPSRHRP
jgi:hypothetical protein